MEKAKRRDKKARNFTEGWIEFLRKKVAKKVAEYLNNKQVRLSLWLASIVNF